MTDENKAGRARRATAPAPLPRQSSRPPEPRPRHDTATALLPAPPRLIRPSEHLAIVERARADHLSPDRRPHTAPETYRPDERQRQPLQSISPEAYRPGRSDIERIQPDSFVERRSQDGERRQPSTSRPGRSDIERIQPDSFERRSEGIERIQRLPENLDRRLDTIVQRQMQPEGFIERRAHDSYVDRSLERRSDPQSSQSVMERPQRPPHLVPSVTVVHGPRPGPPPGPPPVPAHRSVGPPALRMPAPVPQPVMRLPQPRRDNQINSQVMKKKYVRICCPLCYKTFGKEIVASTRCGHLFCVECLAQGLAQYSMRCPTCGTKLRNPTAHHLVYLEDMSDTYLKKKVKAPLVHPPIPEQPKQSVVHPPIPEQPVQSEAIGC